VSLLADLATVADSLRRTTDLAADIEALAAEL
jgi:hypothetical protein